MALVECVIKKVNWASSDFDTTTVESCRNYLGKNDYFQEWDTWVGMVMIV